MKKQNFDKAVKLYYQSIYNYCLSRLENIQSAEENIRAWLSRTSDNIIKKVSAKKKEISIYEAENVACSDSYNEDKSFAELLDSKEIEMLSQYYIDGYDISDIAMRNGKSTASVYKMFQRLKLKLRKYVNVGGGENE